MEPYRTGIITAAMRSKFFTENGTSIRNGVLLMERDFSMFRAVDKDGFKKYVTTLFFHKYGRDINIDAVKCTNCLYRALTHEDDEEDEYYSDTEVRNRAR